MSGTSRKTYLTVFAMLVVLTVAELGMVRVPGIPRAPMVLGLVLFAVAKATLVMFFFMHLRSETRALKLTVIVPLLLPALFAVVLMGDAVWRISR